jgi:ribosomal protein S18 acetylase RimI-like enzyme
MSLGPPGPLLVRSAATAELDVVAEVLADAFREDPIFDWILRNDERRDSARVQFFRGWTADEFEHDRRIHVVERDGSIVSASLWTDPPGAQPSPRLALLRSLWGMRELTGLARFPRFARMVMSSEARHPRFPHYYLGAIGSARSARGSGAGSTMIRATLEESDAAGLPTYLESSNPRNLSFYWRHGFHVIDELRFGRNAPALTLMLREPAAR